MRLRWVGDSRDYVKWDCVFENAGGRSVLYVPMLRCKVDPICKHTEVQKYFDRQKDLDRFKELFPGRYSLFRFSGKDYSTELADEYFQSAIVLLSELQKAQRVLVFIDPDTGVEPRSGAKSEHLRAKDLRAVWTALHKGDKLMVYQHASRTENWKKNLMDRSAEILSVELVPAPYCDERLAKDACFLILEK